MSAGPKLLQAFVELRSEDAEAQSAFDVARSRLGAGARLRSLRRVRLFELTGSLPARSEAEEEPSGHPCGLQL